MKKSQMPAAYPEKLPLTHYDKIRRLRPKFWDYLEQDLAALRVAPLAPVGSVNDFDSQAFASCLQYHVETLINDTAARMGAPLEAVRDYLNQSGTLYLLMQGLNHDYHNLLNFELFGRKTFFFSEALSENLIATELNVDSELVRPPFEACLFVFTSMQVVAAAYKTMQSAPDDPADRGNPVSVFVVSLPDEFAPGCRKILMSASLWQGLDLKFVLKREVAIRPGWSIEQSLRTNWSELTDQPLEPGMRVALGKPAEELDDEDFINGELSFYRLVLNAMLYLGSSDPDIIQRTSGRPGTLSAADNMKSQIKAKKARAAARKESELDYASVGESVKPIYVRKGESDRRVVSDEGRGLLAAIRFIVRGHWRNQPCGPGLTERKLIWVKPYYKGPDMAEMVNRPYVVS